MARSTGRENKFRAENKNEEVVAWIRDGVSCVGLLC